MDMDKALARMAHDRPELRAEIVPLLRKQASTTERIYVTLVQRAGTLTFTLSTGGHPVMGTPSGLAKFLIGSETEQHHLVAGLKSNLSAAPQKKPEKWGNFLFDHTYTHSEVNPEAGQMVVTTRAEFRLKAGRGDLDHAALARTVEDLFGGAYFPRNARVKVEVR